MLLHSRFFELKSVNLLVLFVTFTLILAQRCRHNEFRCETGECLSTEALCDGKRDCRSGEDEIRRGARWTCKSITLAKDYCDPATQFRCRFGGCISRKSICNGIPDCFGGGDEAYDVCENEQTVVVIKPSATRPTPPPFRPRPVETPAPPRATAAPTRAPTRPPPPPPPKTTSRSQFPPQSGDCPPIDLNPVLGFEVRCTTKTGYETNCLEQPSPAGTTAIYSCNARLFDPVSRIISSASKRCENGRWTEFEAYFGCEPKCGESSYELGAFIVGGITAEAGRWPWMAAIYEITPSGNKMEFICGASLISQRAIVTAAHCVVKRRTGARKPYGDLKIVLGKYYRSFDRKVQGEQVLEVREITVHPEYNKVTFRNDIAIIFIKQTIEISSTVRPICLPQRQDYTQIGLEGVLIGWGRADKKVFKEELQQAKLPVVSPNDCTDAHPQFAYLVHEGTFCAGYLNGTSACDGDSGGPLVLRDRYNRHKWVLHGIVSAGIADASSGGRGCNPNYYTVFTDVANAKIRQWIDSVLGSQYG